MYRPAAFRRAAVVGMRPGQPARRRMIVNQWVPAAHRGDAIGDSARRVRDLLRAKGHESRPLRADHRRRPARRRPAVRRRSGGAPGRRHDLPFRAAVADDRRLRDAAAAAASCSTTTSRRRILRAYDANMFRLASIGRSELATLVGHVDLALGRFRVQPPELEALGFAPTGVMPIAVDLERITQAPPRPASSASSTTACKLPVRRPDRAQQEDRRSHPARRALQALRRRVYRFIFVGKTDAVPGYYKAIRALMREYDMPQRSLLLHRARSRRRPGGVLPACRRLHLADEHEGFCVPLLEAMAPTSRCWPTARRRCPDDGRRRRRFNRRTSSTPPNGSACSPTTGRPARVVMTASASGSLISANFAPPRAGRLIAEFA